MKNIILVMIGLLITMYTLVICLNILSVESHRNLLEHNLSRIVKHVLESEFQKGNEDIVVQMIEEEIRSNISKNTKVDVSFEAIDLQKGVISVEIREQIPVLLGTPKEIVVSKTAIMEQQMNQHSMVSVIFWIGDQVYKEFWIRKGEQCPLPKNPDGAFIGWKEYGKDQMIVTSELNEVWENKSFEAVYEATGGR